MVEPNRHWLGTPPYTLYCTLPTCIISSLLADIISYVQFSPNSKFLVVQYNDKLGELRYTDNDQVILLTSNVREVTFSPNSNFFFVEYADKPGELWTTHDTPHDLINNLNSVAFIQAAPNVIAFYSTGQVYLLNSIWLDSMTNRIDTVPEPELITYACTELLSPNRFDEKTLQPYLGNQTPEACR